MFELFKKIYTVGMISKYEVLYHLWRWHGQKPSLCKILHNCGCATPIILEFLNVLQCWQNIIVSMLLLFTFFICLWDGTSCL